MRWSILVGCSLVAFSALAQQYQWEFVRMHATLGKTPLLLFWGPREDNPDTLSTAYVFCAGVDANFNGQQDPGDEPPSITLAWEENGGGEGSLNSQLPWGVPSFPPRPAVVRQDTRFVLYLPRNDRLTRHTFPPVDPFHEDTLLVGSAQAVLVHGDTLFVSQRIPQSPDRGLILKLLPGQGVLDTIDVSGCPNVQQLLWDARRQQLIVLCEGTFGQNNAALHFIRNSQSSTMVPIGDTGNFMLLAGDTLVVVANGSHEVYFIDPATYLWYRMPLEVGTSGYGGPREAILLTLPTGQRTLLVSTYSRDVRWFDLATGSILQILPLSGLAEGMGVRRLGDTLQLWVAQPFTPTYSPDSSIAVFQLVLPTSVAEDRTTHGQPQIRPNVVGEGPAWVEWTLGPYRGQTVEAELFSVDGRRLFVWQLPVMAPGRLAAVVPLSRALVPAGAYVLRLTAGSLQTALPVFVY